MKRCCHCLKPFSRQGHRNVASLNGKLAHLRWDFGAMLVLVVVVVVWCCDEYKPGKPVLLLILTVIEKPGYYISEHSGAVCL